MIESFKSLYFPLSKYEPIQPLKSEGSPHFWSSHLKSGHIVKATPYSKSEFYIVSFFHDLYDWLFLLFHTECWEKYLWIRSLNLFNYFLLLRFIIYIVVEFELWKLLFHFLFKCLLRSLFSLISWWVQIYHRDSRTRFLSPRNEIHSQVTSTYSLSIYTIE